MAKKIFLFLILLVLCVQPVLGFFTKSHLIWSLNGFDQVNSPITEQCRDKISVTLDGNTGADIGVLHYGEATSGVIGSYISTHTEFIGYQKCLQEAGADIEKRCLCYGDALHIIQDSFSHNENGITTATLKKYLGNNYFGHMTVEKNFENRHVKLIQNRNDKIIQDGSLDYYNSNILNSYFTELGGDSKYLDLLTDMSGINMANDAAVFRSGYLGQGFYNTIYKDKITLPWWSIAVPIALILISITIIVLTFATAKSNWKWLISVFYLVLIIIAAIVLISFINGTTWKITTFIIETPPRLFNYLGVTDSQVSYYDNIVQLATNNFLKTGSLIVEDATGLTYTDSNGIVHVGALTKAEKGFTFLIFPIILIIFSAINAFLFYKAYKE